MKETIDTIELPSIDKKIKTPILSKDMVDINKLDEVLKLADIEIKAIYNELNSDLKRELINLQKHSPYFFWHSVEVANLSAVVANKLRNELTQEEVYKLNKASLLHDIGKLGVDKDILNRDNKNRITHEEFNQIKKHSVMGYEIVKEFDEDEDIADIILHHHSFQENPYPDGEYGKNEKLSRILAIIDSFHSMIGGRSYQRIFTLDECRDDLEKIFHHLMIKK